MKTESQGDARVLGPDDGAQFWQPVPANGYVRNLFSSGNLACQNRFSIGTQTVAPRSFIREHTHDRNEEIIFVLEGNGICRLDGIDHPLQKGSSVFVGHNRRHHFLNPNDEPLTFLYIFMPGGLDDFFAEIGREKQPGETAPEPFARPPNVAEIEARTVFGWTDAAYNTKTTGKP